MFTTNHDLEEKDASFTTIKRGQTVANFRMYLTSRIPKDVMDEVVPITGRAFDAYVERSPLSTVGARAESASSMPQ